MHLMLRNFNFRAHTGAWNAAASAIDVALWDIKGKYYDTPVWRLLGGAQRTVPAYLTCGLPIPPSSLWNRRIIGYRRVRHGRRFLWRG